MAVAFTELTAGEDNVDRSSYTTASVTLTAGRLYLIGVLLTKSASAIAPSAIANTTGGADAFTAVDAGTTLAGTQFTQVWRCLAGSTVTDTITITCSSNNGATWSVVEVTGMETNGTNGAGAIVQSHEHNTNGTSDTNTLASNITSGNARYTYGGAASSSSNFHASSATWTEGTVKAHSTPVAVGLAAWNAAPATTDTSAIWTPNASAQVGSTIIEIQVAISGTGAFAAAAAAFAGTATETVTGSGALAASAASLAGTGTETITGTGAPSFAAAAFAGTGTETITGTGAFAAAAASLAGTSSEGVTGTGAFAASAASLDGTGTFTAASSGGRIQTEFVHETVRPIFVGAGGVVMASAGLAGTAEVSRPREDELILLLSP